MRVACLIPGAHKGLQPVKYGAFLRALEAEVDKVTVWNIEASPLDRIGIALRTFSPDRNWFRARFHASPLAFHARTRSLDQLASHASNLDAVLQIGATCDAGSAAARWPLVIYTDYTVVLTRDLGRSFRLDLSDAQIEANVAQERRALARADRICTRSEMVAEALRSRMGVPADRISVVGAGPNLTPLGPRAQPPRLLFFGREFHRKGGDLVLAAFQRLRQEFDWLEIDIVASASVQTPSPGITWHSGISVAHIARLVGQASILLAPSRFETWGDVVVEAMAGGTVPVIVDLPPMPEIVTHNVDGLVVPREDPVALAAAVRQLLLDPGRLSRMSRAAEDRVARDLNQSAVAAKIAAVLREAVGARSGSGCPTASVS